jgi:hypothetical protein
MSQRTRIQVLSFFKRRDDLGIYFDEDLTTQEDFDQLLLEDIENWACITGDRFSEPDTVFLAWTGSNEDIIDAFIATQGTLPSRHTRKDATWFSFAARIYLHLCAISYGEMAPVDYRRQPHRAGR